MATPALPLPPIPKPPDIPPDTLAQDKTRADTNINAASTITQPTPPAGTSTEQDNIRLQDDRASEQTTTSCAPTGALGMSLRHLYEDRFQQIITTQQQYTALADYYDSYRTDQISSHVKETLAIIANVITERAIGLVPLPTENASSSQIQPPPILYTAPKKEAIRTIHQTQANQPARAQGRKTYAEAINQAPPPAKHPLPPKPNTTFTLGGKAKKHTQEKKKADNRVMIRLEKDAFASKSPASTLLEQARVAVGSDLAKDIKAVQMVKSDFALIPSDATTAKKILDKADDIKEAFKAKAVEPQAERDEFCVRHAPRKTLHLHNPMRDIEETEYIHEIEATLGVRPLSIFMKTYDTHETTGTMYISFPAGKVKPGIQMMLFRSSLTLLKRKEKPRPVVQCLKCWNFDHEKDHCTRPEACRLCGSKEHSWAGHDFLSQDRQVRTLKCLHCGGPHGADDGKCPMRPKRLNGTGRLIHTRGKEAQAIRKAQRQKREEQMADLDNKEDEPKDDSGDTDMTGDPEPEVAPAAAPSQPGANHTPTASW